MNLMKFAIALLYVLSFSCLSIEKKVDNLLVGVEKTYNDRVLILFCFVEEDYRDYNQSAPDVWFGRGMEHDLKFKLQESKKEGIYKKYEIKINPLILDDKKNLKISFKFKPKSPAVERVSFLYDAKSILSTLDALKPNMSCSKLKPLKPRVRGGEVYDVRG